jgi:membrane associated rhomboid family serine protease
MILIPIGHEESSTRRKPWITFGVMALCALAFFLSGQANINTVDDEIAIDNKFTEAYEYYLEHPYLELDPEFEKIAFPGTTAAEVVEQYQDLMGDYAFKPTSKTVLSMEQEVLDGLTARALKGLQSHPLYSWGLVPSKFSLIGLVTHMFLHAGWLHLLGNMLILYLAGPFIEDVWGRPLYLSFYLVSGFAAALIYIAFNSASNIPMIGASGAIAGVMGAFLVRYKNTKLKFFYMIGLFWRGTFSAPALVMLPLWFAEQLFYALLVGSLGDEHGGGVAYWAHVGGFVFGFGVALAMKRWRIEERYIDANIDSKINRKIIDNRAVEQALELQSQGEPERAFEMLDGELRNSPHNRDAALALWAVAVECGRAAEASKGMLRTIQHDLRTGDREQALDHWSELVHHAPDVQAEAGLLVRIARALEEEGRREESLVLLRRALLSAGRSPDATIALKIAQMGQGRDDTLARGAARLALAKPGLDKHGRAEAERILTGLPEPVEAS